MNKVITTERIPVKLWLDDIEDGALDQAKQLANLPFAYHHIALMPDCHLGYGMPIGGVMATNNVIVPNAVGVDIGCGMCAVKTSLNIQATDKEFIKLVMGTVRNNIPIGFQHHKEEQQWNGFNNAPDNEIINQELESAMKQIGTLGGGNHFLEIQKDEYDNIWFMIHSGSRNIGLKLAKHYNQVATELCQRWFSNIPEIKGEDGLAFLPMNDKLGVEYLEVMKFACDFAYANRQKMMFKIMEIIKNLTSKHKGINVGFDEPINIHHNYANLENHFGKNVWVHRKGATSARLNEIGIIPGSQGTASYIVRGLNNPDSFMSCSHGAGRKMGRKQAQKQLILADEIKRLDDAGVVHSVRNVEDLDEAAGAYKDIDTVMKNQTDLVEIVTTLKPVAVIKA
jgi:tRNA-splicing ligase RtcB